LFQTERCSNREYWLADRRRCGQFDRCFWKDLGLGVKNCKIKLVIDIHDFCCSLLIALTNYHALCGSHYVRIRGDPT
jgi:hypothetical protein